MQKATTDGHRLTQITDGQGFKKLPEGWEWKKLGEVCDRGSSNVSQNKLANDEGKYPIFGASGFIKNVSFFHNDKPYLSIVKDGSGVGRVTKMDSYTSVIGTLQYIFPKDGIDLDYLFYYLQTIDFKKYVAGAAIPHIYFKDYQNNRFPYTSLPEQKRIVAIIDKAFSAIDEAKANAEKNLANAKELFESYLNGIFANTGEDWEEKKLGEVCEKTDNFNWNNFKGDKKYIDLTAVSRNSLTVTDYQIINKDNAPSRAKKIILTNDVIFATTRPTLKRVTIINSEFNNSICSTGFVVLRGKPNKILPEWIYNIILTSQFMKYVEIMQKGASYPAITDNEVKGFFISFPPLPEQQVIVSKLDALKTETQKLEKIYQAKIEALDELKKSILKKAFEGAL